MVSAATSQGRKAEHTGCVLCTNVRQPPPKSRVVTVMARIAGSPTARIADQVHNYLSSNLQHIVKTGLGTRDAAEREFETALLKCDDYVRNSISGSDGSGASASIITVEQSGSGTFSATIAVCGTNLVIGFVKNKLYAAQRHTTQSRAEHDRVIAAGASASTAGRWSNWTTRGLGYFEMKPANVEQYITIVIPVPQVTQLDAQQGDLDIDA